jgi:hypothetical protein
MHRLLATGALRGQQTVEALGLAPKLRNGLPMATDQLIPEMIRRAVAFGV